jgi:hypothetical protein
MNDKHDDTLDFSVAIVTWAMARGEEHDLDGHDVIRAIAQSLALAIEMTVQTGRKKKMAADMAKIVGSFPPIKYDNQKPLN